MNDGQRLFKKICAILAWLFGLMSFWVILILAIVCIVMAAIVGAAQSSVTVADADNDIYFIAIANVQKELGVDGILNANVLKSSCIISKHNFSDEKEIEKFIRDNFVIKKKVTATAKATTTAKATAKATTTAKIIYTAKPIFTSGKQPVTITNPTKYQITTKPQPTTSPPPQTTKIIYEYEFIDNQTMRDKFKSAPFNLTAQEIEQIFIFGDTGNQSDLTVSTH